MNIGRSVGGGEDADAVEVLFDIGSDGGDGASGVEAVQFALLLVEVDDWLGLVVEDLQPLDDGLLVVVAAAAGLAALDESALELLLSALEVDDGLQVDPLRHHLLPDVHVLLAAREPVQQVPASEVVELDLLLDQPHHLLAGDQLPILQH